MSYNGFFKLRIDQETRTKLKYFAQATGQSSSQVVRNLIHNTPIREVPPADYHRMVDQLRAIGVNLNQLARVANSTGHIDGAMLNRYTAELTRTILDIRRAVELR